MKKERIYDAAAQKRDIIVDHELIPEVATEEQKSSENALPAGYEKAKQQMVSYLVAHGKRLTPEREFILRQIYELKAPVDISTLYEMVCKEQGMVSLSTIYNNLALLVDARLVRRLDLVGGAMAFFEKTLGVEPHGYAICKNCGKIKTIQIEQMKGLVAQQLPKTYQVIDINLQVNVLCKKCQATLRREAEMERKRAIRLRHEAAMAGVKARKTRKKRKK